MVVRPTTTIPNEISLRLKMQFFAIMLPALLLITQDSTAQKQVKPLDVVKERNRALNAHELDSFLATYADDVMIYVFPDKKLGSGKQHLRKIFALFIEDKNVRTRVKKTMVADGFVVVESTTTFGKNTEAGVAIYEVRNGKIKSVRFLRDTLKAKQQTTK